MSKIDKELKNALRSLDKKIDTLNESKSNLPLFCENLKK